MPNHSATAKPLALAMALCAVAPAAASARLDLNPPARTTATSRPAVQVIRVSAPGGFDWADAGIGAGVALGLSMLATGAGLVITDRRGRTSGASDPGSGAASHESAAGDLSHAPDCESTLPSDQPEVLA
jgi:hypothetical protein